MFPFGHGLSYTTFSFSNLLLEKEKMRASDTVEVRVDVTNTGNCTGKEVVQLYIMPERGEVIRPVHELKRFEKIELQPGETKTIKFVLEKRDFAYYEEEISDWHIETGEYTIEIGNSSRNLPMKENIYVETEKELPVTVTLDTSLSDVMKLPIGKELLGPMLKGLSGDEVNEQVGEAMSAQMLEEMMKDMPVRTLVMFGAGEFTFDQAVSLVDTINGKNKEIYKKDEE